LGNIKHYNNNNNSPESHGTVWQHIARGYANNKQNIAEA
jgi:hypothetical protein